jgi:hypothetical protein
MSYNLADVQPDNEWEDDPTSLLGFLISELESNGNTARRGRAESPVGVISNVDSLREEGGGR